MDDLHLPSLMDIEAAALGQAIRTHPALRPFFEPDGPRAGAAELREVYLRFLKMAADYSRHSVPALRAAGEALRHGDSDDRAWSEHFLGYAKDEIDPDLDDGHHVWAMNDMRTLRAPESRIDAPAHPSVSAYARFLLDDVHLHPYAILGTKGVLEHLAIRTCDDLVRGVVQSGIEGAAGAVSFFHKHGIVDVHHVRAGDRNLAKLTDPAKRLQVLQGAYCTAGFYRAFLHFYLSPEAPR